MNYSALKLLVSRNWMWIGIALLALVVVWDWVSIRLNVWWAKAQSPSCGKCGYSVIGLERMVCPECGSDLRQVGIANGQIYRPRIVNRVMVGLIFTACIVTAARVTMPVLYQLWPVKYSYTSRPDLSRPASGLYQGVKIDASVSSYSRRSTALPVQIKIKLYLLDPTAPQLREFTAFTDDGACQFTNDTGSAITLDEPFSEHAILKWFEACGISASDPKVMLEAKRIRNLCLAPSRMNPAVASYATGRTNDQHDVFETTYSAQFSGKRTIPMSGIFIYSIWAALWVTGMMQIVGIERLRILAGRFRRRPANPALLTADHQL